MRTAVVVPGQGTVGRDGVYRITRACRRLVERAETLVEEVGAEAVVFTGWAPERSRSEAAQMRDAWRGPDVELVVEPTATVTAQNAARTLPLLVERGIERAVVVCTPLHLYRARFFFSRIYGDAGIETAFRVARVVPSPYAVAHEVVALSVRNAQLRAARAERPR